MDNEIDNEINNEIDNEPNIQCILNETEDYPFYDVDFILSQFDFANKVNKNNNELDEDEEDEDDEDEDEDEDTELDQLSLFDKSSKQLAIICEYYGLLKSKLKKQDMIEKILNFENDTLNKTTMKTRYKIWKIMDKLKQDKVMKKYIIWN